MVARPDEKIGCWIFFRTAPNKKTGGALRPTGAVVKPTKSAAISAQNLSQVFAAVQSHFEFLRFQRQGVAS